MKPRLISTAQARKYLKGFHPSVFGLQPVEIDTWDIKAIDAAVSRSFDDAVKRYVLATIQVGQAMSLSPEIRKERRRRKRRALERVRLRHATLMEWRRRAPWSDRWGTRDAR